MTIITKPTCGRCGLVLLVVRGRWVHDLAEHLLKILRVLGRADLASGFDEPLALGLFVRRRGFPAGIGQPILFNWDSGVALRIEKNSYAAIKVGRALRDRLLGGDGRLARNASAMRSDLDDARNARQHLLQQF